MCTKNEDHNSEMLWSSLVWWAGTALFIEQYNLYQIIEHVFDDGYNMAGIS